MTSKSLPERMREAAETLEEASQRRGRRDTTGKFWNPETLYLVAEEWEAEDAQKADRESLITDLIEKYIAGVMGQIGGYRAGEEFRRVLSNYDIKKRK